MTDFRAIFGDELRERRVVDWEAVEGALGVGLPDDYRSYAEQYPALYFGSLITILHPDHPDPWANLVLFGKRILEAWRAFGETHELRDLLPWGVDEDLGHYFWRTRGKPSEWTIVVEESSQWWEFDGGFGEFWATLAKGEISSPVIPEGFPGTEYTVERA